MDPKEVLDFVKQNNIKIVDLKVPYSISSLSHCSASQIPLKQAKYNSFSLRYIKTK